MSETEKTKLPFTGSKFFDVIIIIILIISVIGIIAFAYTGIDRLLEGSVFKALPCIMYVLMYISIIQYSVNYFIKRQQASIYSMLLSYCMLTLMSTLTLPNIAEYNSLLILAVLIVILVPLMRMDLSKTTRCFVILGIVLVLVSAMTALKVYYGCLTVAGNTPFLIVVSVYNLYHPLFVCIIFIVLYLVRIRLEYINRKEEIAEKGIDAVKAEVKEEHEAFLESEKQKKKDKKEAKKEAKKEKKDAKVSKKAEKKDAKKESTETKKKASK